MQLEANIDIGTYYRYVYRQIDRGRVIQTVKNNSLLPIYTIFSQKVKEDRYVDRQTKSHLNGIDRQEAKVDRKIDKE